MKGKVTESETIKWTEESMKAIGLYRYIMKIICSWPLEPRNIFWKIRIFLLYVYLVILILNGYAFIVRSLITIYVNLVIIEL